MSNNEPSSTTTGSCLACLDTTSSKLDPKVSLSCHGSQAALALQSNAALSSPQFSLHYSPFIRPAPVPSIVPASSSPDSSSPSSATSRPTSESLCRHDLSPLRIPAASTVVATPVAPGHATLLRSINGASSPVGGNDSSKGVPYSPRAEVEEGEIENSGSSSDVEIFLSSLGLENATHSIFALTVAESDRNERLVSAAGQANGTEPTCAGKGASPQMPPAPLQQTVPLPEIMTYRDTQSATPQSTSLTLSPPHPDTVLHEACEGIDTSSNVNASGLSTVDSLKDCINIDNQHKTPNVYINGLPPHFPEEQLYALAAPFGPVRSVRTFTRHVKDSESGYGFVLFENVEAAERCIIALRKYRNLHPTFSKQAHKIPGITYTQIIPPSPKSESTLGEQWGQQSARDGDMSFKEKMENLHDPTSTNLYMEGLPLSIDEATLAALVSPHRISSSRFFQTRLSNPPRTIAFVRLETRAGAEEIIERLHGRMVRGWNDAGSRISVRFADTAEQRELRRSERANKEGEPSPARLTIAQAALLNMRGQDLRRQSPMLPSHQSLPDRLSRFRANNALYPEFSPGVRLSPTGLTVDYSPQPNTGYGSPAIRASNSYPHGMNSLQSDLVPDADPNVLSLLDSLRGSRSYPGGYVGHDTDIRYNIGPHVPNRNNRILEEFGYPGQQYPLRNGYTPTEEYIMRAHAESSSQRHLDLYRRRREGDATATIGMGIRGYRAHASTITLPQKIISPSVVAEHPGVTIDDFQTTAAVTSDLRPRAQRLEVHQDNTPRHGSSAQPPHGVSRASRETIQTKQTKPSSPHLQQSLQGGEAYPAGHTRSSTLPQRSTVNQHQRHFQHNSMSATSTGNMVLTQDAINAILGNVNQTASLTISRTKPSSNDTANDHVANECKEISKLKNSNRLSCNDVKGSIQLEHRNTRLVRDSTTSNDIEQPSPSLTSPALTYSSQTPSTLSPATPFFGSFPSQTDGFEQQVLETKGAKAG